MSKKGRIHSERFREKLNIVPAKHPNRFQQRKKEVDEYCQKLSDEWEVKLSGENGFLDAQWSPEAWVEQLRSSLRQHAAEIILALSKRGELKKGILSQQSLIGVDFSGLVLIDADLSNIDLSHAKLRGTYLLRCNLKQANLSHADLTEAVLMQTTLEEATLNEATLVAGWISNDAKSAVFDKANLKGAVMTGWFNHASFRAANLQDVWLRAANIGEANFFEASLRGMMIDFVLSEPGVVLPDGTKYHLTKNSFTRFIKND